MELQAKYSIAAEGSRSHLGEQSIRYFKLGKRRDPHADDICVKELWEIDPSAMRHQGMLLYITITFCLFLQRVANTLPSGRIADALVATYDTHTQPLDFKQWVARYSIRFDFRV